MYSVTNTVNGKRYIGSAIDFRSRWRSHQGDLDNGHHNPHLQNAWNKYGSTAFVFEIVTRCPNDLLLLHEQLAIDLFDAIHKGYNIAPIAGSCLGSKHSLETRAKVAAAGRKRKQPQSVKDTLSRLKKGVPFSASHKAALHKPKNNVTKIRECKLGNKNPNFGKHRSEETKKKIADAQRGIPRRKATSEEIERRRQGQLKYWDEKRLHEAALPPSPSGSSPTLLL